MNFHDIESARKYQAGCVFKSPCFRCSGWLFLWSLWHYKVWSTIAADIRSVQLNQHYCSKFPIIPLFNWNTYHYVIMLTSISIFVFDNFPLEKWIMEIRNRIKYGTAAVATISYWYGGLLSSNCKVWQG